MNICDQPSVYGQSDCQPANAQKLSSNHHNPHYDDTIANTNLLLGDKL